MNTNKLGHPEPTAKPPPINWSVIEPLYRAGTRSLKSLGQEIGVSAPAVVKHARTRGWVRAPKPERFVALRPGVEDCSRAGFVYVVFIEADGQRFFRIGMSQRFDSSLKAQQSSLPFEICVAACYFVENMRAETTALQAMFSAKRARGDWLRLDAADLRGIAERVVLV